MEALSSALNVLARLAVCPDDEGILSELSDGLSCDRCGRRFPPVGDSLFDMRPSRTFESLTGEYEPEYTALANNPTVALPGAVPWGVEESQSAKWKARKSRHIALVGSMLRPSRSLGARVLCDVSGGAGDYTLEYARNFEWVIHCDLDPSSLSWTAAKARELGLTNMIFLRVDYLKLPFSQALDYVICLDTLIRGRDHERGLLASIRDALKPGGHAVVDFHNWWHNPLRRLGLLPQNFGGNTSYNQRESCKLLTAAGLRIEKYAGFRQENVPDVLRVPGYLIPSTRFVFDAVRD